MHAKRKVSLRDDDEEEENDKECDDDDNDDDDDYVIIVTTDDSTPTLSGSRRARCVQGKSCLSRAAWVARLQKDP